ncbi:arginase [Halolamina sp. CBA1230]|uniref:arginase n=1 Tax=Halolamina sp. CBA1230 TaxID=1853690 RepID=UPI0009A1BC12|nr:arginase [Halolamina sp. CBA1230]QKY19520.1 arginase [Halolamina sp. CBA1230]
MSENEPVEEDRRSVRIIGAPTDYGQDRRGVDMGPSAIRYGGLSQGLSEADVDSEDAGDLLVPRAEERDAEYRTPTEGKARFLRETEEVCSRLSNEVQESLADGHTPLVLGGDHSIAIGTISGSAADAEIGAIWFDAHGDLNTPTTSPSGNVHGMPLAALLGVKEWVGVDWANAPSLSPANVAIVGLRSLDDPEREILRNSEISAFTMSDIDEHGLDDVVEKARAVAGDGTDGYHVSLDLDWLDPTIAPGVGTPVRGGVDYREAHHAMEQVAEDGGMRSMELVEVNPTLDQHNETAELAVELAASAFGKRIL